MRGAGAFALGLLLSAALPGGERGFAAGPYLLDVTENGATVAFHLREPMPAVVRVLDGNVSRDYEADGPSSLHFVPVDGLASGRAYRYEVICAGGRVRTPEGDGSYEIRTAGRPGESFTFAVYGDPRPGDTRTHRHHREVVAQAMRAEPSFCLILGDMVDDGSQPELWDSAT